MGWTLSEKPPRGSVQSSKVIYTMTHMVQAHLNYSFQWQMDMDPATALSATPTKEATHLSMTACHNLMMTAAMCLHLVAQCKGIVF